MPHAGRIPVPTAADRHLLNRFSYGTTPSLAADARAAGGANAWFQAQLDPALVDDSSAAGMRAWFPFLAYTPGKLWQASLDDMTEAGLVAQDLQRWTLLRRTYSKHQVLEHMTSFWSDLLHIPASDGKSWPHRIRYDATIRQHALGRFDELLIAATTHPAMCCYLDNAVSTGWRLNENLGREVLELHTVGRDAAYSQQEVIDSARILTGYRVDMYDSWVAFYSPDDHYLGPVEVLGFQSANRRPNGQALALNYLRHLARHPATARRIARRLCVRFVSDVPSTSIVNSVATAYLNSGTDIPTTLKALVAHPDFLASAGAKLRTPVEDAAATYRVLGVRALRPQQLTDFANAVISQSGTMGQRPFDWPRPDGPPDVADAWSSVSRMLMSWSIHYSVARRMPANGATFRDSASWLPPLPATLGEVIDHICRQILGRPSNIRLRRIASERIDLPVNTTVRTFADLGESRIPLLLAGVLDTPEHMKR